MRLIDADVALQRFIKETETSGKNVIHINTIKRLLQDIDTAYDVEKVVKELEQQAEQYRNRGFEHEQKGFSVMADKYYGKQCSYLHAIDIVRKGDVE